MAITDDLPGVQVEIIVDGVALHEYDNDESEENERTTTRYIEAVSGQEFAVRITLLAEFKFKGDCIAFDIFTDGVCMNAPLIQKMDEEQTCTSQGAEAPGGKVYKYRFASLETVSDGRMKQTESEAVARLGTISIECEHHNMLGPDTRDQWTAPTANGIVSEKALGGRALSHSVDPQEAADGKSSLWDTCIVAGTLEPAAIFDFHYCSRAALNSMHVIPRTPTPPPLEKRDFTTLTPAELRELQKRVLELTGERDSRIKVKREKADSNPRPRKVSRPTVGDTQLEIDDDGRVRESSTPTIAEQEVIEID